jgi:hypothetical protein
MMKSWRTTLLGVVCLALFIPGAWLKIQLHDYSIHAITGTIEDWSGLIALLATGFGLIHAKDHKADK